MLIADLNFTEADEVYLRTVQETVTAIPYLRMRRERDTNRKYRVISRRRNVIIQTGLSPNIRANKLPAVKSTEKFLVTTGD